jgi:hypothetical protein
MIRISPAMKFAHIEKSFVVSHFHRLSTMADPSFPPDGSDPADPANPFDDTTNPCINELETAEVCIFYDAENCYCMGEAFLEVFPVAVENSFRKVLAISSPGDPDFCQATNDNLCEFLQTSAACCCTKEVTEYSACILVSSDSATKGETISLL